MSTRVPHRRPDPACRNAPALADVNRTRSSHHLRRIRSQVGPAEYQEIGVGSASAALLFVIIAAFTAVYMVVGRVKLGGET